MVLLKKTIRRYHRLGSAAPLRLHAGGGREINPPFRLEPGMEARVGEATIIYSSDGVVRACDLYGCFEAFTGGEASVEVRPLPGIHRLKKFSPFIYIELAKSLYARPGSHYWVWVPVDLEVSIGSSVLGVISPVQVKYTLVGDVLGGTVCRHYRSEAYTGPRKPPAGLALLGVRVKSKSDAILPGIGFNALKSPLYRDSEGNLYYSLVEAEIEDERLTVKVQEKPPLQGLVQVYRPRQGALAMVQQLQPFTASLPSPL